MSHVLLKIIFVGFFLGIFLLPVNKEVPYENLHMDENEYTHNPHISTATSTITIPEPISTTTIPKIIKLPLTKISVPENKITLTSPPQVSPPQATTSIPKVISASEVYDLYHPAVLNIWCSENSTVTSGTATLIDPTGILLTNAHVIEDVKKIENCVLRSANPFANVARFRVLYIAPQNALIAGSEFQRNDFAFLKITEGIGEHATTTWPSVPVSFSVPQKGENLFVFGYSTEFVGYTIAVKGIPLLFSTFTVQDVLNFDENITDADVATLRSGISAQAGASGAPLVNGEKNIVALLTLVTEGKTTADRESVAILLSYINRIMQKDTGFTLPQFLEKNR